MLGEYMSVLRRTTANARMKIVSGLWNCWTTSGLHIQYLWLWRTNWSRGSEMWFKTSSSNSIWESWSTNTKQIDYHTQKKQNNECISFCILKNTVSKNNTSAYMSNRNNCCCVSLGFAAVCYRAESSTAAALVSAPQCQDKQEPYKMTSSRMQVGGFLSRLLDTSLNTTWGSSPALWVQYVVTVMLPLTSLRVSGCFGVKPDLTWVCR